MQYTQRTTFHQYPLIIMKNSTVIDSNHRILQESML